MKKVCRLSSKMIIISMYILFSILLVLTGCTAKPEVSITKISDRIIEASEQLNDLLDFDWNQISSITIKKYVDDEQIATATFRKQENIIQIKNIFNEFTVVHKTSDNTNADSENAIYEINFNNLSAENNKEIFLSIGPKYQNNMFEIGGSFIDANWLEPRIRLVQNNQNILFTDISDRLDLLISNN